jgi:N-terminal domain of galactosyltransferase
MNSVRIATRAADYVVLRHDPSVPGVAADFWDSSLPHYQRVDDAVRRACDRPAATAYRNLVAEYRSGVAHREFARRLAHALDGDADRRSELAAAIIGADREIAIDYHLGDDYDPSSAATDLARVMEWANRRPGPPGAPGADILVVIGFRDRSGTERLRNLVATLAALHDQSFPRDRYHLTVVESDTESRWRRIIEPLADTYLFGYKGGEYNRSWTSNVGVVNSPVRPRMICILDADMLVDRYFLGRNWERLSRGGHDAHVPYRWPFCLDEPSTNRAIELRLGRRHDDVPATVLRAMLMRETYGHSNWLTADFYHRIGGFDERFEGWGGEDDDFGERVRRAGRLIRYDDQILHLDHPRPAMRVNGRPFNAHIPMATWTGEDGYGDIRRFS